MPWLQLTIRSSREQAESVEDTLLSLGAVSVTLQDSADEPIFEPALGETPLWQQTSITGLFDATADTQAINQHLQQQLGEQLGEHQWSPLEDRDWEREWIKHYQPIQCGERLWICPSWQEPPNPKAVNLLLDPGLAFGTGTHPTTFLCLQWLDTLDLQGVSLIDYGCGSGILAIAALLLGASHAQCVDIDPQALLATADNAERNGISSHQFSTALPDQHPCSPSPLVLANILAGPLVELAPSLASITTLGGKLCLSGIIESQAEAVMSSYKPWFEFDVPATQEQWVRLTGTKVHQ